MSERANLRAQRAKIRPETTDLRLLWPRGGTEGRMEGRTDVWKFPPVSYRTSALCGRCPKRDQSDMSSFICSKVLSITCGTIVKRETSIA